MRSAESRRRGPRLSLRWKARSITDPVYQTECEALARQIERYVGGEIKRITAKPPEGVDPESLFLGPYRGHNPGWHYHEVVVTQDRVYDAFTGHQGLPIAEFKALWDWQEGIEFGF